MASPLLPSMSYVPAEITSGASSPSTLVDLDSSSDDRLDRRCKRKRTSTSPSTSSSTAINQKSLPKGVTKQLPITPPASPDDVDSSALLSRAIHVLTTEAAALAHVSHVYQTDVTARTALLQAVEAAVAAETNGGKVIVCGVGKSGYIAMKIAATMKSLGVRAAFMHAAEALHGDLGDVRDNDIVLFISFSGKTAELVTLASHLHPNTTVLALTAHPDSSTCPLLTNHANTILLPAPIHMSEEASFGVSAPTTSTTVAIAVGDMLALTTANQLYQDTAGIVFQRNHPGGSIGAALKKKKLM